MVSEPPKSRTRKHEYIDVLILVLVEDGLRAFVVRDNNPRNLTVLILVLVEDGLRETHFQIITGKERRLNPCSCGGWSQSLIKDAIIELKNCLNPCSCGGWSQSSNRKG